MATLNEKLNKFAFVTVFNPTFYEKDDTSQSKPLFQLDSLSISNFTQEGPNKTAKGGLYANTLLRYGKTMRLEMEDVIGKIDALENLMGVTHTPGSTSVSKTTELVAGEGDTEFELVADSVELVEVNNVDQEETTDYTYSASTLTLSSPLTEGDIVRVTYTGDVAERYSVTDRFASPKRIVGETFVVDENGNKNWINVVIPSFLPDSIFNQTMEAEGDFGVISIAGDIQANDCGEFYYFTDNPNSAHTCN